MNIEIIKEENINIIKLHGELIASKIDNLKIEIEKILEENNPKIILDFSDVDFIDSLGIGIIINILKKVTEKNGVLKLSNLGVNIKDIFSKMQLLSLFDIYESLDEAVEAFY